MSDIARPVGAKRPASPPAVSEAELGALVEVVRAFSARELAPAAELLDEGRDGIRERIWQACVDIELDRALVAEQDGGGGLDAGTFCDLLEELGAGDAGTALVVLLHNAARVAGASPKAAERWAIVPAQLEKSLPRLVAEGDKETLEGQLPFVMGADGAAFAVLLAETESGEPRCVAADLGRDEAELERKPWQMGLRSAPAAAIRFRACPVETVGPRGAEAVAALRRESRTLLWLGVAAIARGIARAAQAKAGAYAEERHQGGVPIVEHDAVKLMLASMTARRGNGRIGREALAARGGPDQSEALAAKIAASDAALATAIDAVQVFGGAGYMTEAGVEKLMRDAKYCQLFPEPNIVARLALAELMRDDRTGKTRR